MTAEVAEVDEEGEKSEGEKREGEKREGEKREGGGGGGGRGLQDLVCIMWRVWRNVRVKRVSFQFIFNRPADAASIVVAVGDGIRGRLTCKYGNAFFY